MKILFRVRRRVYFDQQKAGTKNDEMRRASIYWRGVRNRAVERLGQGLDVVAVLACGKDLLRRRVVGVSLWPSAGAALGREPSAQGRLDLGDGEVIKFALGDVVE